jgi:hypothetical protein
VALRSPATIARESPVALAQESPAALAAATTKFGKGAGVLRVSSRPGTQCWRRRGLVVRF